MSVNIAKNNLKIFGLTGGIASGKSTAAKYFVENGIKVFDSDLTVKQIWENNLNVQKYMLDNYQIDMKSIEGKSQLSKLLFSDRLVQKEIEELIHPIVLNEIEKWKSNNQDEDILIIDMPLLYEINYQNKVDDVILIYVNKDIQIKRLMERNSINYDEAVQKIGSQMSLEEKKILSKYVIDNNSSKEDLMNALSKLIKGIRYESK